MPEDIKQLINQYKFDWTSRKMWIGIILFLIATAMFVMIGKDTIPYEQWSDFVLWIFGIFAAANALSKAVDNDASNSWKSRKLWGLIVIFIASSTFVYFKLCDFSQWSSTVQWLYGLYCGANIVNKAANGYISGKNDNQA